MKYMKIEDLDVGDVIKITRLESWMHPIFIQYAEKYNAEIYGLNKFGDDLYLVVFFIDDSGKSVHEGHWQYKLGNKHIEVIKIKEDDNEIHID